MRKLYSSCEHDRLEPHYPTNENGKQSPNQCRGAKEVSQADVIMTFMSSLDDCPECDGTGVCCGHPICHQCNGVGKNLPFLARAWARDHNPMDDTDIVLSSGFVQNLIFDTLRYMVNPQEKKNASI